MTSSVLPVTYAFNPLESMMWQTDADMSLQFRIVAVVRLDSEPDADVLADRVERLSRGVPRFRHRVVDSPLPGLRPHWELDPHFDLRYHLRHVRLPEGAAEADLFELASRTCRDGFPTGRSPWRMTVVTGLPDGAAALVVVMHHVLTDGVGSIRMAAILLDLAASGRTSDELGPLPEIPAQRSRNGAERVLTGLSQEIDQIPTLLRIARDGVRGGSDPLKAVGTIRDSVGAAWRLADPTAAPGSPMPRSVSPHDRYLTLRVPVADLKAAGRAAGGSLNDAFIAMLVGGMSRYHERHGHQLRRLAVSMPVNMRTADATEQGGNEVLLKICHLPADITAPAARIAAIRTQTRQEQTEGSHLVSKAVLHGLARLPGPLLRGALGTLADTVDFMATNVPGVPVPLYLAGAQVTAMHAFVSRGRSPLTAALVSYNGTADISLNIDPSAIPDTDVFLECIQEELEAVLELGQTDA